MNRFIRPYLLATVFVACATPVLAADLYAPPRASIKDDGDYRPRFSWTGFYLGVNAGYGWGRYRVSNTAEGNADAFDEGFPGSAYRLSPDGFIGGVHGGFNWQINSIVLGIEGDVSFANSNDSVTLLTVPPDDFARVRLGTHGTIAARLGLAAGRWMPYLKGGLAFGDIKANAGDIIDGTNLIDLADETRRSVTRTGYVIGGGLEYALTDRWLLKAEYNFIDLGTFKSGNLNGDVFKHEMETHTVKAGISYKF